MTRVLNVAKKLGLFLLLFGFSQAIGAAPLTRDETIALQLALDDAGFSPGLIDGSFGGLTRQALAAWQTAHDLKPTGEFDAPTLAVFPALGPNRTNLVITATDLAQLTPIPEDWQERSQLKEMAFSTIPEMLAEQSHASEALIRTLNPGVTNWVEGQTATMLVLKPRKLPKAQRLSVSLTAKTITAFDESGKVLALFPCSIAADKEKRPVGQLSVAVIATSPNYTYDPANFPELDQRQKSYGKLIIPPGPNNPVGTAWIGLSRPGYGIHGTPHPDQIGKTFSHGCFRLANWNASRLAQMVTIGTPVEVVE